MNAHKDMSLHPCGKLGRIPEDLARSNSVPDTSGAMVRNAFVAFGHLHLLHSIVEEEIDQNSIEVRLRVLTPNLAPQKLDAPDAASPQLDLPRMTALNCFHSPNVRLQWWAVLETAEGMEHLRDPVVREHGDLIDVMEAAEAVALEAGPEVCD